MSACQHRRQSGLVNVNYGDEPCPICEAEEKRARSHRRVLKVFLIALVITAALSGLLVRCAA